MLYNLHVDYPIKIIAKLCLFFVINSYGFTILKLTFKN